MVGGLQMLSVTNIATKSSFQDITKLLDVLYLYYDKRRDAR